MINNESVDMLNAKSVEHNYNHKLAFVAPSTSITL